MRSLTSGVNTQVALQTGAEPSFILKIQWAGGTVYYSEKPITLGTVVCKPSILSVDNLSIQQKQTKAQAEYNGSSLASCNVVLSDTDGTLKTIQDNDPIQNTIATVYQYFDGLALTDLVPLIVGRIYSPVVWSEGKRTLTFDIVSKLQDIQLPYASDGTDVALIFPDAIGKAIPMVFGAPINVPAVKLYGAPKGTLRDALTSEAVPGNVIYVNNGTAFPQGSSIDIIVGTTVYTGVFSGNNFTISVANKPKYTNLTCATRPLTDVDNANPKVIYLNNATANLVGYNCYIGAAVVGFGATVKAPQINYCWKQVGNKCFFINNWVAADGNPVLLDDTHHDQIDEVASLYRLSWGTSQIIFQYGFNWRYTTTFISWWWSAGSRVTIAGVPDVYVANQIPSSSVIDVQAFKKIDSGATTGGQTEMLLSIPTSYYTVNLNDSLVVNINGVSTTIHPTTITFAKSLSDIDPTWKDDQIFVTLRSSQGPNVSDIIKYLIQNYTDLTVDASSFATVKAYFKSGSNELYPANFALLTVESVLKIIQEIAWQARCGIRIEGTTVSIVYLSKKPGSLATITEDTVDLKSIEVTASSIEEVFTYFTALWRDTYMSNDQYRKRNITTSPDAKSSTLQGDYIVETYQANIAKFGLHKLEYKFYIYNIQTLVRKSMNFWGHRLSNIFRKVDFLTYLNALPLEIFDALTFGLTDTTLLGTIIGVIEEQHLQSDYRIKMTIALASLAGTKVEDALYWQDDSLDTAPADPAASIVPSVYSSFIVTGITNPDLNVIDTSSNSGDNIVLGIITASSSPTDFTVDFYENGYSSAATDTGLAAELIGNGSFIVGDQVVIHINSLGNFIHGGSPSNVASAACAWNQSVSLGAGLPTIDGYAVQENDLVLVAGQSNAEVADAANGLYKAHNASAWTKVNQPEQVLVKNGTIWAGKRFYLSAANTYKAKMEGWMRVDLASRETKTPTGNPLIDSTATSNGQKILLYSASQTKRGVYVVAASTWIYMGLPDGVSVNLGAAHAGFNIFKTSTGTDNYAIEAKSSFTADYASTASSIVPLNIGIDIDGATGVTQKFVLLKDQSSASTNGIWYIPNFSQEWIYLGAPDLVYVTTGNVNASKLFIRKRATNTYVAGSFGTGATVRADRVNVNVQGATSGLPNIDTGGTMSDGQVILLTQDGANNGLWIVHSGAWVKAPTFQPDVVLISSGTNYSNSVWYLRSANTYSVIVGIFG